jgi:2-iminobutanoate/2-iminopropanoate deaminase
MKPRRVNVEGLARLPAFSHAVVASVFLADMGTFVDMNAAYLKVIRSDPPARITVGRADLALGAAVEIDCIAYKQRE